MGKLSGVAVGIAALSMLVSVPAKADSMSGAEKLRRLDIMFMVTALRCRTGPDAFQVDYGRFTTNHIRELNASARQLRSEMAARFGPAGADRALDRFSTTMANAYGQGHPWLGCHDLKTIASNLADAQGPEVLIDAADQLLSSQGSGQFALARR